MCHVLPFLSTSRAGPNLPPAGRVLHSMAAPSVGFILVLCSVFPPNIPAASPSNHPARPLVPTEAAYTTSQSGAPQKVMGPPVMGAHGGSEGFGSEAVNAWTVDGEVCIISIPATTSPFSGGTSTHSDLPCLRPTVQDWTCNRKPISVWAGSWIPSLCVGFMESLKV